MPFNSYSYEILYEQFHLIYLQEDIQLLLVTVNNRLKFENRNRSRPIVSPYIVSRTYGVCSCPVIPV